MKPTRPTLTGALLASTAILVPGLALAQQDDAPTVASDETITVLGAFVPDEKRETSEISSIIDSEFLAQTQETDISETLKRVTGVSIDEGFVIVRGLNERYSRATLNGAPLPSNDPLRNIVPLDIFPTAALEGVLVQKTFSPQYNAEFGGGLIELRTVGVPDEGFFEIGGSLSGNTVTNIQDGFSYAGDGFDFTGTDDITDFREFPSAIPSTPAGVAALSPAELELAGEAITNSRSIQVVDVPVNFNVTSTFGDRAQLGDESAIGFVGVVNFGNDWFTIDGIRQTIGVDDDGLIFNEQFSPDGEGCDDALADFGVQCGFFETTQTINLNALATVGLEIDNNNIIKVTSAILRQTTKEALLQTGEDIEEDLIQFGRTDFIERQTWTNQVVGEHYLPLLPEGTFQDTLIKWRASYSEANRTVNNRNEFQFTLAELGGGEQIFRLDPEFIVNNQTVFAALEDASFEFGLDIEQPFEVFGRDVVLKIGGNYGETDRNSDLRRFFFDAAPGLSGIDTEGIREQIPEIAFGQINIDPEGLFLVDNTSPSDAFSANDEFTSAYALLDVQLTQTVRLSAGFRYQDTTLSTQSFAQSDILCGFLEIGGGVVPSVCLAPGAGPETVAFEEDAPIFVDLNGEFLLPAVTVTWEFLPNVQVRAGFSQTINRPSLRELSTSPFLDPDRDEEVEGNPFLTIAEVDNFDVRFEWYFGPGEFATIGAFYKQIDNPIEETFLPEGNVFDRTFLNGNEAELIGMEAEIQKNLPFQDWFGWDFLGTREFYVNANFTFVDAETTIDEDPFSVITNTTRDLQGQSPILANLRFGFDDIDRGERAAILFNFTDGRIDTVGVLGTPDQVERPPALLDLVYSKEFSLPGVPGSYELSFRARNLLNDDYELLADNIFVEQYDLGRTFSMGLRARF